MANAGPNAGLGDLGGCAKMTFAAVKYWTAKEHGPREPGEHPEAVRAAAELMIDAMVAAWRAGCSRSDEIMRATQAALKRRQRAKL